MDILRLHPEDYLVRRSLNVATGLCKNSNDRMEMGLVDCARLEKSG